MCKRANACVLSAGALRPNTDWFVQSLDIFCLQRINIVTISRCKVNHIKYASERLFFFRFYQTSFEQVHSIFKHHLYLHPVIAKFISHNLPCSRII